MEENKVKLKPFELFKLKQNVYSINEVTQKVRKVSTFQLISALISFAFAMADLLVTMYISSLHKYNDSQLFAWLTMLPILLNFIGMFTFLSNKIERRQFEELGGKRFKNWMFFPVIGPSICALRLVICALEKQDAENFERLESLIMRLKQYESFFRAAPEAYIQITNLFMVYANNIPFQAKEHWTTACIFLSIYSLAESHMYSGVIDYYKMFQYVSKENAWKTDHVNKRWKFGLFVFAYLSIYARLVASSMQVLTSCLYFTNLFFAEVVLVNFIMHFILRATIYAVYNTWMASIKQKIKMNNEGVYGAFTYSWRCIFLSFDFQSHFKIVFIWFYIENILMVLPLYVSMYVLPLLQESGEQHPIFFLEKHIFHIYAGLTVFQCVAALLIKFGIRHRFETSQINN